MEFAYDDLQGQRQGPFPASSYAAWHAAGFLAREHALVVVGGARDGERVTLGDVIDGDVRDEGEIEVEAARPRATGDGDAASAGTAPASSALDDRLSRLLAAGGGTLPTVDASVGRAAYAGELEPATSPKTKKKAPRDALAKAYARPKTWRDILSTTRARVSRGRAAMGAVAEDGSGATTLTVALDASDGAADPREDYRELLRNNDDDEEGALPALPPPIDLREPFWALEDRATQGTEGGVIDADALNAAVAEQLARDHRANEAADADARSDRSDISWSAKPGGLERQAKRAAEREAALLERKAADAAAAASYYDINRAEYSDGDDDGGMPAAHAAPREVDEQEILAQRKHDMLAYYAANPYAGQWWLPDDNNNGAPMLGPYSYEELVANLPHIMVAHRRDDDAWRVVGPYTARDKVEGYGRAADGAPMSFSANDGAADVEAARERDIQTDAWFDVVTEIIDVENELTSAPLAKPNDADTRDIESWFSREMEKVALDSSEVSKSKVAAKQHAPAPRKRRRGFEMRVSTDDVQNHTAARVIGELYKNLMKNRKRFFASIVDPVLADWEREQ